VGASRGGAAEGRVGGGEAGKAEATREGDAGRARREQPRQHPPVEQQGERLERVLVQRERVLVQRDQRGPSEQPHRRRPDVRPEPLEHQVRRREQCARRLKRAVHEPAERLPQRVRRDAVNRAGRREREEAHRSRAIAAEQAQRREAEGERRDGGGDARGEPPRPGDVHAQRGEHQPGRQDDLQGRRRAGAAGGVRAERHGRAAEREQNLRQLGEAIGEVGRGHEELEWRALGPAQSLEPDADEVGGDGAEQARQNASRGKRGRGVCGDSRLPEQHHRPRRHAEQVGQHGRHQLRQRRHQVLHGADHERHALGQRRRLRRQGRWWRRAPAAIGRLASEPRCGVGRVRGGRLAAELRCGVGWVRRGHYGECQRPPEAHLRGC